VTYVKVDLAYRVAYLVDDQGIAQRAQSDVTRSSAGRVLDDWGYEFTPGSVWEITDILNAIDAVRRPVQQIGS
jgi:hypothetical protein